MRPLAGDAGWVSGRHRPGSDDPLVQSSAAQPQMSFVLADEASIDSYAPHAEFRPRQREPRKPAAQPAQPLPTSSSFSFVDCEGDEAALPEDAKDAPPDTLDDHHMPCSPLSRASAPPHSPASMISHNPSYLSRPITPIMLGTSCTGSVLSSPSSRRNSITDSVSEHALDFDQEEPRDPEASTSTMLNSGSAPQLVMPSIKMPSRRPFTPEGKAMGRMKVLLAGDSGVGKTSLIKSIVQTCEHIVHADSISPQTPAARKPSKASYSQFVEHRATTPTKEITEIFASTKPYPDWRSELEEARLPQRRKSLGDSVLERNICFVDTPGYSTGSSAMETVVPCVDYVQSHLNRVSADMLTDSDMLNMLGGDGGFQVDVVLYLVSKRLKPADIEYMRRLAPLTNLIPLLTRVDTLSADEIASRKAEIAGQLDEADIKVFSFSIHNPPGSKGQPQVPYAVSSANAPDHDVMDASLLMSPDYVPPLVDTELVYLVGKLLSLDGSTWIRHAAAKKYMQWRETTPSRPRHLYKPLDAHGLTGITGALVGPPTSRALATLERHQSSEHTPQFKVVDWAADLQRSLLTGAEQFEVRAQGEGGIWLDSTSAAWRDGVMVPANRKRTPGAGRKSRRGHRRWRKTTAQHQDPLGLLQVIVDLKTTGWKALELMGGLGLIGGLALLLARQHWHMEPVQLADEWARLWGMDV